MTKFESLDRDMQAPLLVGRFLQVWAAMESELSEAIATAFRLDAAQAAIVTSNISLRDKIHILRTVVHSLAITKEAKKEYDDTLVDISDCSRTRNMMAHDAFFPDHHSEGVRFFVIKAKKNLTIPREVWKPTDFYKAYRTIDGYSAKIIELTGMLPMLTRANPPPETWPIPDNGGLGLLGLPIPPAQAHHSSDTNLANPETGGEKPPSEAD